jgi:hypothetical protein
MEDMHKRAVPSSVVGLRLFEPSINDVCESVAHSGFAFLQPPTVAHLLNTAVPGFIQDWEQFRQSWDHLQQDTDDPRTGSGPAQR